METALQQEQRDAFRNKCWFVRKYICETKKKNQINNRPISKYHISPLGNIIDLVEKICLQMFIQVIKTDCCLFSEIVHIIEFALFALRRYLPELWTDSSLFWILELKCVGVDVRWESVFHKGIFYKGIFNFAESWEAIAFRLRYIVPLKCVCSPDILDCLSFQSSWGIPSEKSDLSILTSFELAHFALEPLTFPFLPAPHHEILNLFNYHSSENKQILFWPYFLTNISPLLHERMVSTCPHLLSFHLLFTPFQSNFYPHNPQPSGLF